MKDQQKKADRVTRGLLSYLQKTGQLQILPSLIKETVKKSHSQKDPSVAVVTSAIALSEAEKSQLQKVLSALTEREMSVENRIDTELIAGLHIQIADKIIDNSLGSKLQNLGERLVQ